MCAAATKYRVFASCTPQTEWIQHKELTSILGPKVLPIAKSGEGGIEWLASREQLWKVANCSRTSESLRVRLAKEFKATTFAELQQGLQKLPWRAYLPYTPLPQKRSLPSPPSLTLSDSPLPVVSVTCHKSKLYHSNAVKERVVDHVMEHVYNRRIKINYKLDDTKDTVDFDEEESSNENSSDLIAPKIFVRLVKDSVQISIDASGTLLHRRTHDKHVTEAPIRETIAAACLVAAGYRPGQSIWDPFCGSGTFLTEAMGMSRGGAISTRSSRFAFECWRSHVPSDYDNFVHSLTSPSQAIETTATTMSAADTAVSTTATGPIFFGSDIDPRAIDATRFNIASSGYQQLPHELMLGDFEKISEKISSQHSNMLIIANLPYGYRLPQKKLIDSYRRFGKMLHRRQDFRNVFVVSGNKEFVAASGHEWQTISDFPNRGLSVQLLKLKREQQQPQPQPQPQSVPEEDQQKHLQRQQQHQQQHQSKQQQQPGQQPKRTKQSSRK